MPAFATSASSGSVNAANTASRSLMSTTRIVAPVERRLVAIEQRQPRALGGEPLGDREPDAARRSGDGDVLPLEAVHAAESTSAARSEERSASARGDERRRRDRHRAASTAASTLCVS